MSLWNPQHYLRYADERTRPSQDLAARIDIEAPAAVVDLGCGPGNSTRVLCQRWPDARILGLDSSPDMIASARRAHPDQEWLVADIATWQPAGRFDVVFSNATLQWLPHHEALVRRLFGWVAPGGAFAFQIPSATFARVRTLIHEIAQDGPWAPRMGDARAALTMETPVVYYDCLASSAASLDIWETEYHHVLPAASAIVDWMSSTGLRPFLDALDSPMERDAFLIRLNERVAEEYPVRGDGRVLFPFRRTFVIAYATP